MKKKKFDKKEKSERMRKEKEAAKKTEQYGAQNTLARQPEEKETCKDSIDHMSRAHSRLQQELQVSIPSKPKIRILSTPNSPSSKPTLLFDSTPLPIINAVLPSVINIMLASMLACFVQPPLRQFASM